MSVVNVVGRVFCFVVVCVVVGGVFEICVRICSGNVFSVFLRDFFLICENEERERNVMLGCMEKIGEMS